MQMAQPPHHRAHRSAPRHRADTPSRGLDRRSFLALAGTGAAAATVGVPALAAPAAAAAAAPRWAGHQPGRVYLGVSGPGSTDAVEQRVGALGARRTFYTWTQVDREVQQARSDHAADRLPWLSFKPPGGAGTWKDIAAGRYDADLAKRATAYAGLALPLVVTFHHEPTNDSSDGAAWGAAYNRIYDVMNGSADLAHVAFSPIIGDWAFNQKNKAIDPAGWLTSSVLQRTDLLGIDCYQNRSGAAFDTRLEFIHGWLTKAGHGDTMLGVGETGATETFGTPAAATWWNTSWQWAEANTDKIGLISYFNSTRNSKANVYWALDESKAKEDAFRRSLASATSTRLDELGALPASGGSGGSGSGGSGSGGSGSGGGRRPRRPRRTMTGYGRDRSTETIGEARLAI